MLKKIIQVKKLSYCFAVISLVVLQACSDSNSPPANFNNPGKQQQRTSVETVTAETKSISDQIKSFGNIKAEEIVNITPQVSNRITHIYADLGDTVRQGDVLAKIYDTPFRDQFEQAKSQLEQSRSAYVRDSLQFNRQKKLYEQELISSSEFDEAHATFQNSKAQYESSRANLTQSRENLNNTEITSPVYGVVLSKEVSVGDVAATGQTAFEIANLTGYQTRIYLPAEEWRKVKVGQQVNFRLSNESDISGRGRVSRISPRLDPTTGLGEVVISLTEKSSLIAQGVLVESTINVETHENAVVVPRSTLVENVQTFIEPESNSIQLQRSYSVFLVEGDSLALQRELELGIEQGDQVEILEGIEAGDEVVITGQRSLGDSTKVRIANQQNFNEPSRIPIENSAPDSTAQSADLESDE
ncbi:efflux transporter periplasmic adaptor subunit [Aliifodinibius salipaludis]|uniref:Efflux transporter periplasmic adaptor subunit n=1 Tax=Fodinibius salipaludis TaxID=2032627 RepID=A0A2A2G9Q4_9BACT|nr:efflux transporter periplasmic adaptor subunit [Aliifodinibius salipaludis]